MHVLFFVLAALSLWPAVSAGAALLMGLALATTLGNPLMPFTRKLTHRLLTLSVMGLGAGMDLRVVLRAGSQGIAYTVASIALCLLLGEALGRVLRVGRPVGLLITVGTAICGGSAIAAVGSVLRAREHEISVALGTVFLLNAVALLIFPPVGHALHLQPASFGLWAAIAIHDTSSVVGAALRYGPGALEIATPVKLARALWIVPLCALIGHLAGPPTECADRPAPRRPWFILGFVASAALCTYAPGLHQPGLHVAAVARQALVLALFLIGASLTRASLLLVGPRALFMGLLLWLIMGALSLAAIYGLPSVGCRLGTPLTQLFWIEAGAEASQR